MDIAKTANQALKEAIIKRKSTRLYDTSRNIEANTLECILQAALQAPSPKNRQPWNFTVVTDKEHRAELSQILNNKLQQLKEQRNKEKVACDDLDLANGSVRAIKTAPVVVFVEYVCDINNEHGDEHDWCIAARPFEVADLQSIGASIQNMLLEATIAGVSSLWMCDVLYAVPELSDYLKLEHTLIAAVALGYEAVRSTPRFGINEKVKYFE